MIISLKIKGFKNLRDIKIDLGPFTCIAGVNAVGKSNLFDAIRFLNATTNNTLTEAAFLIRESQNEKKSASDIRNIFYHNGITYCNKIEFEVDMVIPKMATDHLGQNAKATTTSVKYKLVIGYREEQDIAKSALEIISEDLKPITKQDMTHALKRIGASKDWISSVLEGRRTTAFIETSSDTDKVEIRQDGVGGRKKVLNIHQLPRTVLSTANAIENPTALITKKEMESWQLLQLEPSSLRSPDDLIFTELPKISTDGKHLPATLFRLIADKKIPGDVRTTLANRLNSLIDDVFKIDVEKDDKRDVLTLMVKGSKTPLMPARSLSDGTLRFLALAVIENDPEMQGVICMEEPENGIHPKRIPAILELIKDIATDITLESGDGNPLRQVIINTHSPIVVSEIPDESLLFAETNYDVVQDTTEPNVGFLHLKETWRGNDNTITIGKILDYLRPHNPQLNKIESEMESRNEFSKFHSKRVIDRDDIQLSLFKN
jgi:predicted ATPase